MAQPAYNLKPPPGRQVEEPVVDEETFVAILRQAVTAVRDARIPFLVMGGLASSFLGRERWTHDIDFFVKPGDATRTLDILSRAGFATQKTDAEWLYKAIKNRVLVDIIFCTVGTIEMDDAMLARAVTEDYHGVTLPLVSPEDLVVIKAQAHREDSPRHWHDALALLEKGKLDWDYLLERARQFPARVASLLLYAKSLGMRVPDQPLQTLIARADAAEA